MFEAFDTSAQRTYPKWLVPLTGLFAAAWAAYLACRIPPRQLTMGELFSLAVYRVLLVLGVNAAIGSVFFLIFREEDHSIRKRSLLATSSAAVWLAPLALLLWKDSLWGMVIAGVFVLITVRSYSSLWPRPSKIDDPPSVLPLTLESPSFSQTRMLSPVFCALCVEAGTVIGFAGHPLMGAILLAAGLAILTWFRADRVELEGISRTSPVQTISALALAIVVMCACLLPYALHGPGKGGLGFWALFHAPHGFSRWEQHGVPGRPETSQGTLSDFAEAHPGIVLWPEKQAHTVLIAPPPTVGNVFQSSINRSNPMVIPFDGVYWYFKAPDIRPPAGSHEAHGSPELLNARSTDRRQLSMEARLNLGTLLSVNCCSRIEVAIRNTDRYPESVHIELILIDTSLPGKPSQSLGSIMVKSTPPAAKPGPRRSTPSIQLGRKFPIPSQTLLAVSVLRLPVGVTGSSSRNGR